MFIPKDSVRQKAKLHWGYIFSFNNCYRFNCNYNKSNSFVKNYIDSINTKQIPDYGYYFGLTISKKNSEKFFTELFLLWKDFNFKTKTENDNLHPVYHIYSFYFISVPLFINYTFFSRKYFSFFIGTGITPDIKINAKDVVGIDNMEYYHRNIQCHSLFINGSGKLGVNIGDKYTQLILFTNASYSFNGIKKSTFIGNNTYTQHLYHYGIGINLTF